MPKAREPASARFPYSGFSHSRIEGLSRRTRSTLKRAGHRKILRPFTLLLKQGAKESRLKAG